MSPARALRSVLFACLAVSFAARSLADGADTTHAGAETLGGGRSWLEATHITPPPQAPLAILGDAGVQPLREAFAAGDGETRIVLLMSPT